MQLSFLQRLFDRASLSLIQLLLQACLTIFANGQLYDSKLLYAYPEDFAEIKSPSDSERRHLKIKLILTRGINKGRTLFRVFYVLVLINQYYRKYFFIIAIQNFNSTEN